MKVRGLIIGALAALAAASVAVFGGTASAAQSQQPPRSPVAQGTGGGAATMSPYATGAAISVLRARRQRGRRRGRGGRDARRDRAVRRRAGRRRVLGLLPRQATTRSSPSTGARRRRPARQPDCSSTRDGQAAGLRDARVESGLSVGVPGMVATWGNALRPLRHALAADGLRAGRAGRRARLRARPRVRRADRRHPGRRSRTSPRAATLFLPGGQPPAGRHRAA